ncbi:MAG: hypothetical protein ACRCZF_08595 [Gemmataceae bacterium]
MPASTNTQQALAQLLKVLEKSYDVAPAPEPPRPVMEELIYAICREGVAPELADQAYTSLKQNFFDWNEVRVSTVLEVSEAIAMLPQAGARGQRIVEFLQELFEMTYEFSLTDLEKKGLKQAAKQLGRHQSVNAFAVAWVTQRSLGGHAIPLDEPTLAVLRKLGIIEEDQDDQEVIRGRLEHFIPKAKGPLFTDAIVQYADEVLKESNAKGKAANSASKTESAEKKPKPKSR